MTERRTPNALTDEEEMKTVQTSRRDMDNSMLLYSQKMHDISERKSNNFRKSPVPFHSASKHKPNNISKEQSTKRNVPSSTSLPSISSISCNEMSLRDDFPVMSDRKPESRSSLDSSLGSQCYSSKSLPAYFISDTDKTGNHDSVRETTRNHKEGSSGSVKIDRPRQRKRFCDSKTFKFMPIADKETKENEEVQTQDEPEEEIETPRIAPFPDELLQDYLGISSLVLASLIENDEDEDLAGDSIVGKKNKRGAGVRKNKARRRYVLFRPKASQSQNLAALRQHRFFKRYGPRCIYFRYSDEVLEALRNLNNSHQRRGSSKSNQSLSPSQKSTRSSSPILHGLDLEELLEAHSLRPGGLFRLFMEEEDGAEFFLTKDFPKPQKLSRERSTSVQSSKGSRQSFVSKLEQIEENESSSFVKSALKKEDRNLTKSSICSDKKTVQFFLPDIFMKPSASMSHSTEF